MASSLFPPRRERPRGIDVLQQVESLRAARGREDRARATFELQRAQAEAAKKIQLQEAARAQARDQVFAALQNPNVSLEKAAAALSGYAAQNPQIFQNKEVTEFLKAKAARGESRQKIEERRLKNRKEATEQKRLQASRHNRFERKLLDRLMKAPEVETYDMVLRQLRGAERLEPGEQSKYASLPEGKDVKDIKDVVSRLDGANRFEADMLADGELYQKGDDYFTALNNYKEAVRRGAPVEEVRELRSRVREKAQVPALDNAIKKATAEGKLRTQFNIGVPGAKPGTKGAQTDFMKRIVDAEVTIGKLDDILNTKKEDLDRFLSWEGEFEQWIKGKMEKTAIGRGFLNEDDEEFLERMSTLQAQISDVFNEYRRQVTGQAAAVAEIDRLEKDFISRALGPTQFRSRLKKVKEMLANTIKIRNQYLMEGFKPGQKDFTKKDIEEANRKASKHYKEGLDGNGRWEWPEGIGNVESYGNKLIKHFRMRGAKTDGEATAQAMEQMLQMGMISKAHRDAGLEAMRQGGN